MLSFEVSGLSIQSLYGLAIGSLELYFFWILRDQAIELEQIKYGNLVSNFKNP